MGERSAGFMDRQPAERRRVEHARAGRQIAGSWTASAR
jgi:hypothetical protein